ncbi:hypothetical protein WG904_17605 [Pedobacter sp. Du54]|uniref:hypothetical protein n=1 Tax=Pedobacter anseongensis TaxID=3133439 RepID=UPI0030AE6211
MKFLRKNRPQIADEATLKRISDGIVSRQTAIAEYLNKKVRRFSARSLRLGLIGFSIAFGSYCLYLIVKAFN